MRRAGLPEQAVRYNDERFASARDLRGPITWYRTAARSLTRSGRSDDAAA